MKIAIPFAVPVRKTEPSSDRHRGEVDNEDVDDGDTGCPGEPRQQQRPAADRTDDERLKQAALRVGADDTQREEDREHDAEEERREHREAHQERARERARVDVHVLRRRDGVELREHEVVREPEEEEEDGGQEQHDGEHPPPHRLAEAVFDDRRDGDHDVSPPTASRYVSSSVDVSTRAP
jgi:hypothetical protein